MSSLSSAVTPKSSPGHGHDGHPPHIHGGGDDFRGDGSPDFGRRMRRARFGLVAALIPIFSLFVGISVAYLWRYHATVLDSITRQQVRFWVQVQLPVKLLLFNTFVLLLSSFTMEMARRQIAQESALAPLRRIPGLLPDSERKFPWLGSSTFLGVVFLVGQGLAWRVLEFRGFFMSTGASSGFVYMLTGTHAVHLAGGIVVLVYAQMATLMRKDIEHRRIVVDITAWYWHFMAVLWICIFALLYLVR